MQALHAIHDVLHTALDSFPVSLFEHATAGMLVSGKIAISMIPLGQTLAQAPHPMHFS